MLNLVKAILIGVAFAAALATFVALLAILPYVLVGGFVAMIAYACLTEEKGMSLPPQDPGMRTIEHQPVRHLDEL